MSGRTNLDAFEGTLRRMRDKQLVRTMSDLRKSPALKQSLGWFPVLVVVVPCLWGLSFWFWDWPLAVIAALLSVYLVLDGWKLVRTKRAARQGPEFLEKKTPEM